MSELLATVTSPKLMALIGWRMSGIPIPFPETLKGTVASSGSLLLTLKLALFDPIEDGVNRTVIAVELPAPIAKGVEGPI